ncbi:MAG: type II secretion system F family protein, partial [Bacilli bacterium]|nr:type II secretion system F family protein [Bacilli bacterium]
MKKFKYTAINADKKKFTGTFMAEDEESLREQLILQKLYLVKSRAVSFKPPNAFFSVSGKVKVGELTTFCRQFSIMISSGILAIDCLSVLKSQSYTGYFKKVLEEMHEDVKAGKLISEAMEKHKNAFPEFFRSMTYVGEMSGTLDKVLVSLADYFESDSKLKAKTKSAMVYPIMLLVMLVGVVMLMMIFVIPTFRDSLAALDVEMPALTMTIFNFSEYLIANWMQIFLYVFVIFFLLSMFGKTKKGRYV